MSTNQKSQGQAPEKTYFEQQREVLLQDIAVNMEQVLQNINKLNRSLESVIAVGNEFGQVEGLWSQFEGVMARDGEEESQQQQQQQQQGGVQQGAQDREGEV